MGLKFPVDGFHVLDAGVEAQNSTWMDYWVSWKEREIFAHPEFVKLFCREGDRAICGTWRGEQGGVLFPLIKRPLETESWAKKLLGLSDLIGPYGYGGPYFWGDVNPNTFWEAFGEWAEKAGIVSCFTRLSLFAEQLLPFSGTVEMSALNIVRTLDAPLEELWMRYEHKVRKNVKRALSEGIFVERDDLGSRLEEFLIVYYSTMERRCAHPIYRFSKEFFLGLIRELPGQFAFFHALKNGQIVSSELVLISQRYIYSFLGGTLSEAFAFRPNDLIKHSIIQWSLELGKSAFILGGGYVGSDGIFRYKRSFAPDGERPFSVGKRVWDDRLYARIVEMRRANEAQSGKSWTPRLDFFPAYRS
jgi:hypothetical protein